MIKVQSMENTDANKNSYFITAFADTKEEVIAGDTIVGLPEGATIEFGSKMKTAKGDFAYMQSDGQWNWI